VVQCVVSCSVVCLWVVFCSVVFQQHLLLLRGMSKRPADEANAEAGEEAERQLAACAAPKAKAAAKAPPAGFTVDARGRLVGPPDLEEAERQQQQYAAARSILLQQEAERQRAACAAPKAKAAPKAPPAGFTVDARGRLVGPPEDERQQQQQQQQLLQQQDQERAT